MLSYSRIPTQDKTVGLPLKILLLVPKPTGHTICTSGVQYKFQYWVYFVLILGSRLGLFCVNIGFNIGLNVCFNIGFNMISYGMTSLLWCHMSWRHSSWQMPDARCITLVDLIFVRTVNIPNHSFLPCLEMAYNFFEHNKRNKRNEGMNAQMQAQSHILRQHAA